MADGTDAHLLCARCEYDLATLAAEDHCPECGYSIDDSMRVIGLWRLARLRRLRTAVSTFTMATISWTVFAIFLAIATDSMRVLIALTLAAHAVTLIVASLLTTSAASRQSTRARMAFMLALAALALIAATATVVLSLRIRSVDELVGAFVLGSACLLRCALLGTLVWWMMRAVATLAPEWSRFASAAIGLTAIALVLWFVLIGLLFSSSTLLDAIGVATIVVDVIASVMTAAAGRTLIPVIRAELRSERAAPPAAEARGGPADSAGE